MMNLYGLGRLLATKVLRVCVVLTLIAFVLTSAACAPFVSGSHGEQGRVYYLNSKAEIVEQLESLAREYTRRTGVEVVVLTAASGTNDQTLVSELAKSSAPTMFNIAGYDQFARFKKFMKPLQNTKVYSLLTKDAQNNAFSEDGQVYTLPYAAEWYGIIYNKRILETYISKDYAIIDDLPQLNSYDVLDRVTRSLNKHKEDMSIKAVWSLAGA
ncbi:extracellular solute-binding protein [Alloscardovia omnicolens]|uniref:extracellular solute-binding protein n=1 Tax=Alloscardovia omnicolens TaxID=419015 RepID=UPI003A77D700